MNKVQLHGFAGKDPEIKTLESGKKIAKFSIATTSYRKDKDGKKITDWHNIVVWDKLAELCEKYVKKGSELIVEGEISYREYTDKDGVKKNFTEIICNGIEFCGKKEEEKQPTNEQRDQYENSKQPDYKGKVQTGAMSNPDELPGEAEPDGLPF